MAAKLREKDGCYWVVVHHQGRRKWKKVGQDKRVALKVVHKVNAQIALGKFSMEEKRKVPTVAEALDRWYEDYLPTFSPSYAQLAEIHIRGHLIPFFGSLGLDEITEKHLLQFISSAKSIVKNRKAKSFQKPLSAGTLKNILSTLRHVIGIAVEDGQITKNPCRNLGRLLSKVKRQQSDEVEQVNAWSRTEVATLLEVAKEEEPTFYPLIAFLLSTGCRRGEALALKWEDIDFGDGRVSIRRSLSRGRLGTPKSGKARSVVLSFALILSSGRSLLRAPPSVPQAWLGERSRVCLLLGDRRLAKRTQRRALLGPTAPEGTAPWSPASAASRCAPHVRKPRLGCGQERALGVIAIGSREPGTHASGLRTRDARRGNGPQFP
jgi:integrase